MDGLKKLSELTVCELMEIVNQKFLPSFAGDVNPNAFVLVIDGNIHQTLSIMSEICKIFIREKFGINTENNSVESNFIKVPEPKKGKTYFRISKDEKSLIPCRIIDGALFRNGRISNVWEWTNLLTGEKEHGYGGFFELNEG